MQIHRMPIVLIMLSMLSGCYTGISGKVIDSVTQQPIEGQWSLFSGRKLKALGLPIILFIRLLRLKPTKKENFHCPVLIVSLLISQIE